MAYEYNNGNLVIDKDLLWNADGNATEEELATAKSTWAPQTPADPANPQRGDDIIIGHKFVTFEGENYMLTAWYKHEASEDLDDYNMAYAYYASNPPQGGGDEPYMMYFVLSDEISKYYDPADEGTLDEQVKFKYDFDSLIKGFQGWYISAGRWDTRTFVDPNSEAWQNAFNEGTGKFGTEYTVRGLVSRDGNAEQETSDA
jgi:hypothetical protein